LEFNVFTDDGKPKNSSNYLRHASARMIQKYARGKLAMKIRTKLYEDRAKLIKIQKFYKLRYSQFCRAATVVQK